MVPAAAPRHVSVLFVRLLLVLVIAVALFLLRSPARRIIGRGSRGIVGGAAAKRRVAAAVRVLHRCELLLVVSTHTLFVGTGLGFAASAVLIMSVVVPPAATPADEGTPFEELPLGARVRHGALLMTRTPACVRRSH